MSKDGAINIMKNSDLSEKVDHRKIIRKIFLFFSI